MMPIYIHVINSSLIILIQQLNYQKLEIHKSIEYLILISEFFFLQ